MSGCVTNTVIIIRMVCSRFLPFLCSALLLSLPLAAHAAKITDVQVIGISDELMLENVNVSLSAVDSIGKDIPGRRVGYLVREADDEVREALEPFGYYSPDIKVEREGSGDTIRLKINIALGEPVRVRHRDIAIMGEGSDDRYLKEDLAAFKPQTDDPFVHSLYEASKTKISRRLAERGYFDADFLSHRVEVTRADYAADVDLVWDSGDRYDMGETTFVQEPKHIIRDSVLEKLVYWEPGEYYHQGRLDRLRRSLIALDYFSRIDIQPHHDQAVDKQVPVTVTLTPAKRSIYTAGLSYGTESGPGVRLGVERRYVNDRGHKALAQLDYAQKRKTMTLQYRVPAFAWLDGWYTASLQYADEQTDYIDTRRVEFVASRSGQYNRRLNLVASLHVLRERWGYYEEDNDPTTPVVYRAALYTFPSLAAEYSDVNDKLFPTRGFIGRLSLKGGIENVGSDASFGQIHARLSWFKTLGERYRLIARGEVGYTLVEDDNKLNMLPPSLRFYAGGEGSIRGYEFREVGPRIGDFSVGARNVTTASLEMERYFNATWGGAVFVDSGSAFNGANPVWRTGVGVGVRWKSPVGLVRFDIARGLDNPDSPFTIGLNIGTGL